MHRVLGVLVVVVITLGTVWLYNRLLSQKNGGVASLGMKVSAQ